MEVIIMRSGNEYTKECVINTAKENGWEIREQGKEVIAVVKLEAAWNPNTF